MTIKFVRWLAFSKNSPRLRQTSWCWPQISLNAATLVRYQSSSQAGLWIYTSWLNAIYSSTPRDPGVNDYMVFNHDPYTLRSRAWSIQPKFQPVRPGKEDHLKRWTRFFETFPVGLNRSIEFGWMDRAPRLATTRPNPFWKPWPAVELKKVLSVTQHSFIFWA